MKTAYYSVFYQLLRFTFWVRTPDTQQWSDLIFLALLQSFNAFVLYAPVAHYLSPTAPGVSVPGAVGFYGALVYGNYRLLRSNPVFQHPATVRQQPQRPATAWLVGAYVLLTVLVGGYYLEQMHDVNVAFRH